MFSRFHFHSIKQTSDNDDDFESGKTQIKIIAHNKSEAQHNSLFLWVSWTSVRTFFPFHYRCTIDLSDEVKDDGNSRLSSMVMASGKSMCVCMQQVKEFRHWKVIGCLGIFIDLTKVVMSGIWWGSNALVKDGICWVWQNFWGELWKIQWKIVEIYEKSRTSFSRKKFILRSTLELISRIFGSFLSLSIGSQSWTTEQWIWFFKEVSTIFRRLRLKLCEFSLVRRLRVSYHIFKKKLDPYFIYFLITFIRYPRRT